MNSICVTVALYNLRPPLKLLVQILARPKFFECLATVNETTTPIINQWPPQADHIHPTMPTSASFPQFSPQRLRSYILRLPLITRIILIIIIAFWIAGISHGFQHWAQLIPSEVIAGGMHRINTYPLLHLGLIHTVSNLVALAPLLERFEAEHGSLVTLVLFTGRMWFDLFLTIWLPHFRNFD